LPLALFHANSITGDEDALKIAVESTGFLETVMMDKGYLSLVGSNGWYKKGGNKSSYPQQAIDTMSMVLLFQNAYQYTGESHYRKCMIQCYSWFHSENDLGISLYDPQTQG